GAGEVARLKEARRDAPLASSPSGGLLAAGGERQVSLRDAATGVQRYFLNASRHESKRLAFTPDGQTLVSAGLERDEAVRFGQLLPESTVVCLWDVTTGQRRKLPLPLFSTDALAIAADASVILWGEPRSRGVPLGGRPARAGGPAPPAPRPAPGPPPPGPPQPRRGPHLRRLQPVASPPRPRRRGHGPALRRRPHPRLLRGGARVQPVGGPDA